MADAGWYPDPNDAAAERWWDGNAWTTATRPATAPGYPPPAAPTQPDAGQPWMGPPAGYAPGWAGATAPMGTSWGKRAAAYLIDVAIAGVPMAVAYVVGIVLALAGSDSGALVALAALLIAVAALWSIGFNIYNLIIVQGRTGQSYGKRYLKIRLVGDQTGQPIGAGSVLVRYLAGSAFSSFTCGIGGIVDLLFPLWEPQRKRLIDKWLHYSVVDV